jgi:hypothetical protein
VPFAGTLVAGLEKGTISNFIYVHLFFQATPRLSEDKVKQCVDPRLKGEYPPKGVAKVSLFPTLVRSISFILTIRSLLLLT